MIDWIPLLDKAFRQHKRTVDRHHPAGNGLSPAEQYYLLTA
ncbi:hypothetical protein [Xenorhabdus bovienii]|nr:hypothetical protein [Xenorhabdus bovienii]